MTMSEGEQRAGPGAAGIGDSDLDILVVHNLLQTHRALAPFLDAELRGLDLTSTKLNALLALRAAGEDGLLMSEIGERLVVTKANITGLVDRLEERGLVVRGPHCDRRVKLVRLTPAGQALLHEALPLYTASLTSLTECFSEAEKRTLVHLLSRLRRGARQLRREAN
jgi:MarR family 2-MHQ and catechol resistance regulon transcriptional repressor